MRGTRFANQAVRRPPRVPAAGRDSTWPNQHRRRLRGAEGADRSRGFSPGSPSFSASAWAPSPSRCSARTPQGLPAAAPTTVSAPPATGAASGTETAAVTAQITVNDACVRAINASQDAYQAITELGDAAKQFDIARLDAIVRRLQPIQTNLQNDIAACNITTKVSASAPSTSPTTR